MNAVRGPSGNCDERVGRAELVVRRPHGGVSGRAALIRLACRVRALIVSSHRNPLRSVTHGPVPCIYAISRDVIALSACCATFSESQPTKAVPSNQRLLTGERPTRLPSFGWTPLHPLGQYLQAHLSYFVHLTSPKLIYTR
jgi:hypothetical protein